MAALTCCADTLAGQMAIQMVLQAGCIISGAQSAGNSDVTFRRIDFGGQTGTYSGALALDPSGARSAGRAMPGTGAAVGLPVYARIQKNNGNAIRSGTYSDLPQITLSR